MRLWAGLAIAALLAGCADDTPAPAPVAAAPLDFDYLTKLRLNVASVAIDDGDAGGESPAPVPPADLLRLMARERLVADGSAGQAKITIEDASIVRDGDQLTGSMAVRLDVANGDGSQTGFADARVARSQTLSGEDERAVADTLERRMMADMNVEFEYQIRRSLKDWLLTAAPAAPPPAPVQSQDLPPPTGS